MAWPGFLHHQPNLVESTPMLVPVGPPRPFAGMLLFVNRDSPDAANLLTLLTAYGARFATSLISCTHLLIDTSSPRYSSLLTSKPPDEQTERILAWLGRTGKILSYQWARGVCAVGLEESNREVLPLTLGWAAAPPPPPAPVEVAPVVKKTVGKVMLKRPVETMRADEEVVDREENAKRTASQAIADPVPARIPWDPAIVDSLVEFLATGVEPNRAAILTSQRHTEKSPNACSKYYARHHHKLWKRVEDLKRRQREQVASEVRHDEARLKRAQAAEQPQVLTNGLSWTSHEKDYLLQQLKRLPNKHDAIAAFRKEYPNRSDASVVKRCWLVQQEALEDEAGEGERSSESDEEVTAEPDLPSDGRRRATRARTSGVPSQSSSINPNGYHWSADEVAYLEYCLEHTETRNAAATMFLAKYPARSVSSTRKRAYEGWHKIQERRQAAEGESQEEESSEDDQGSSRRQSRRRARASSSKEEDDQEGGSKRARVQSPSESVPSLSSSTRSRNSLDRHPSTPPSPRLSSSAARPSTLNSTLTHLSLTLFPTNSEDYIATFIKPLSLAYSSSSPSSNHPPLLSFANIGVPPPSLPPAPPSSSRRYTPASTEMAPFCYFCGSFTSSSFRPLSTAVAAEGGDVKEEQHESCRECEERFEVALGEGEMENGMLEGKEDFKRLMARATEEVMKRGKVVRKAKMRMEGWK